MPGLPVSVPTMRSFALPAFPTRLLRGLCLAGALAQSAALQALELAEPAIHGEPAAPPRMAEDPARPVEAPTVAAIDTTAREDGAAAGLTLARKALTASRAAYGPQDARTLVPLINTAHAQQRAGDVAGALLDYRRAIELGESAAGPRDARLFDAWYGAGYAHLAAGHAGRAAEALETALQLHRVNHGLYSAAQLDVLHALALAQRALGKTDDADALQVRRLDVAERVYGRGTPQVVRRYVSIGRWFREVGRSGEALALHALAVEVLTRKSKDDPQLIEPLIELALSGGERRRDADGAQVVGVLQPAAALARAEQLAETHGGNDPAERARHLIRIGDVHYALGRKEPALRVYAKAAALLAGLGATPPFDQPAFVSLRPPRPAPLEGPGGHVLVEFGLDANGRTREVKIVEAKPSGLPASVSAQLVSAIKSARLRPRIINGQPVASSGLRFRLPVRGGTDP